jgi:hypothetical protein
LAGAGVALIAPARAAAASDDGVAAQAAGPPGPIGQLPLQASYPNLPALPVDPAQALETISKLTVRAEQIVQATQGLTARITLGGVTRTAYSLLYERPSSPAMHDAERAFAGMRRARSRSAVGRTFAERLQAQDRAQRAAVVAAAAHGASKPLSLEHPQQFAMSWTTLPDVQQTGAPFLAEWTASLTDAASATRQFWPMIAQHGLGFNLLLPERVSRARARSLRSGAFGAIWERELQRPFAGGDLYAIDMSRFEALSPQSVGGAERFTPATITLLTRDPRTRNLMPVAIAVSGADGRSRRLFSAASATDGAWLYALQAAKVSITVFGIWLGHVYPWHLVTAAMLMTMLNTLPAGHPILQLVAPQSGSLIGFDDVLLGAWPQIAPPTSLSTATQFLALADDYAAGRSYFDDDPATTLTALGVRERDFTQTTPWDRYPIAGQTLALWELVADYVGTCVRASYGSDTAVARDSSLQAWIRTAGASAQGNVRGLPQPRTRATLARILTSLLYRVTVHGASRLVSSTNPTHTFVANFPHCLQRSDIPRPNAPLNTRSLLSYLPDVATIGSAISFYFTFAFSPPYTPAIPLGGIHSELFFPGGPSSPRNRALIRFRTGLLAFMNEYQPDVLQRFQWPRDIET